MRNDQRTVLWITLGMMAITLLAAQRCIVTPHRQRLAAIRRQLQEEQELLRVQEGIARHWPLVKRYAIRLPEVSSPDWLMREVARLAEQSHIQLRAIEPELSRPYEHGATRMTVRVSLESAYHDVGAFIGLLESSPKYIHVDEVELRPAKGLADISAETDLKHFLTSVRLVLSTLYLPPISGR